MKRILLLLIPALCCITAHAQTDSIKVWNKWCVRKDTALLFNAANNMIGLYSPTLKPADIKVKSLDPASLRLGKPEVKGDTIYVLAMPYPAKSKKMRMAITGKKGKVIRTVEFASDNVPAPEAQLGNLKGKEAMRKDILAQLSMKVVFPNSLYNYPYSIRQYLFKIKHEKGSASIPVNGFMLTRDILQQIKDAPTGTVMEFTAIKATCPECAVRTLEDLKIKIK